MKTAIVYDRVNKWGGAERVLLTLHEIFPDAPLYTSVYNRQTAPWAEAFPKVITSFLQNIPYLNKHHELIAGLMPMAFESFDFNEYDLVISVTSEAAKGIITKPKTKHVCYCLTPTRYLWSHYHLYFRNKLLRTASIPVVSYLRNWDMVAAQRPDVMVSISDAVKKRINKYYGRESTVIYPPVNLMKTDIFPKLGLNPEVSYLVHPKGARRLLRPVFDNRYFLVVSRLVPYKRVDLVVETFNRLNLPLVIVGAGSEEKRLKKIAKRNIYFAGLVSEENLVKYYQNAKALIFPQEEDFGITAVEAQAAGTPVIAYKEGGALDTVIDRKTGVFFNKQTSDSLMKAIAEFKTIIFKKDDMIKNAENFSKKNFKKRFLEIVRR